MLTLALLLTGWQTQDQALAGEPKDECRFRLGPASAMARVERQSQSFSIEITVTNDTDGPLWWRGAGIGCIGVSISQVPVDEDGRRRDEFLTWSIGCSMEKDVEPSAEQLDEWRLDPGESWTDSFLPFARWSSEWNEEAAAQRKVIPTLVRWGYEHEFTIPRVTPPPTTMDFECPYVTFAWDRELGLRVFVDGVDGDTSLPHFDPFDDTPFFREFPIEAWLGPLVLTVDGPPDERGVLSGTVRNPGSVAVSWWAQQLNGTMQLAPGQSRPIRIGESIGVVRRAEEEGMDRYEVESTWPVLGESSSVEPPRATLHVVWEPSVGLSLGLRDAGEEFELFGFEDAFERRSGALRCGAGWLIARCTRGVPYNFELRVLPVFGFGHWTDDFADTSATEEFRWREDPAFGTPRSWKPPPPSDPPHDPTDWRDWVIFDGDEGRLHADWDLVPSGADVGWLPDGECFEPWEWRRVILTPLWARPADVAELDGSLVTARWSQDTGLTLSEEPAPPQR
jgi:hypothetical protein